MVWMRWLGAAVGVLLLVGLTGCVGGPSGTEILIGVYGSPNGSMATGINLAVEEINNKGGVMGKKIKVITADDMGDGSNADAAVTKLVTTDRVVAVLGEAAGASVCQSNQIPMLAPTSTNIEVTKKGNYIFRVCSTDQALGYAMAQFARTSLKQRAAILYSARDDSSKTLAAAFDREFKRLGGEIVITESYTAGAKDFSGQLGKIKNAKPDVIFAPGNYTEVALIGYQARESGIDTTACTLVGGNGWESETLAAYFEKAQGASESWYYSAHFSVDNKDPMVQAFIKRYKKEFKKKPDAMAALGYDAARILVEAIAQADKLEGSKIRDALALTKDFPGVTGKITLDKDRNASKPVVIVQIKGNTAAKHVATVNPPAE